MRVGIVQRAATNERFARDAFDGDVGRSIPVNLPDGSRVQGILVAAEVSDDGSQATLTLDVISGAMQALFRPLASHHDEPWLHLRHS